MTALAPALAGLRDVDDVHGSFLIGARGELLARDLPAVFRDDLFGDVGPRLVRLRETLEASGQSVTSLVLRFAEHKLHVRAVGAACLCVLTGAKVNSPALRMATNLVARRVEAESATLERRADEPTSPLSQAPPAVAPPAPHVARRDVLYRGRRPG